MFLAITHVENQGFKFSMSRLNGSLDANVIVRLLTKDIPSQYEQAQTLINSGAEYDIADTAIIEAVYALHEYYNVPRTLVAETIGIFQSNKNLRINNSVFEHALRLYSENSALSIEDCYLASVASHRKALPLWTFDKKLAKQSNGLAKEVGRP